jgi:hypothetical protein
MKEEWDLIYELHYIFFGVAFLFLTAWRVHAIIQACKTPLLVKSRINYAVNTVLLIFTSSRALVLLLHGYGNNESASLILATHKFLFNIGFPCLIAAYTCIIYPYLEYLKDRERCVLAIVLVQSYLFIAAETVETTIPYGQHVSLYINFILSSSSFLFVLWALIFYTKSFFSKSSDISMVAKNSDSLSVDIVEEKTHEMKPHKMNSGSATYREIVALFILLIWISCAVIWSCIMTGDLKVWNNDICMDSWYSWMYANVLRMIELINAAVMLRLIQHVTLKPSHGEIWY